MDFQRQLLEVGKALLKDEVKALAFLCTDFIGRNSMSVDSASDLFSRLSDQDYLSAERPQLLTELLLTIQRTRLVRNLRLTDQQSTPTGLISNYRKLLYNLSEEITDDDLKNVKFLLNTALPRRRLEEHVSTLEVFLEMEHMDRLSETNLNELEMIIQSVCPVLKEKIKQFKAQQVHQTAETISCEIPASQRFADRSRTSSDMSVDLLPGGVDSAEMHENSDGLGTYSMTATRRGVCLIINNNNFTTSITNLKNRVGTMFDEQCLKDVFEWLDFDVEIHNDCSSEEIRSVLQKLGRRDHSQMDCVVCCILSHGQEGSVVGVDGHTVDLKELCRPLNGLQCSSLVDKPKLFFIQACQGTNEQMSVYIESDSSPVCSDAVVPKVSIPSDADFLLSMSTVPSFVSFRDRRNGSWFIQTLCQNLVQMVPRECDLMSILTKVNADVSQKTDFTGCRKQMPQPAFTLRKKVVFPIPRFPPPHLPSISSSHKSDDP